MGQLSLFDTENALEALSKQGDPLERLNISLLTVSASGCLTNRNTESDLQPDPIRVFGSGCMKIRTRGKNVPENGFSKGTYDQLFTYVRL